jgi:hypothetical protein
MRLYRPGVSFKRATVTQGAKHLCGGCAAAFAAGTRESRLSVRHGQGREGRGAWGVRAGAGGLRGGVQLGARSRLRGFPVRGVVISRDVGAAGRTRKRVAPAGRAPRARASREPCNAWPWQSNRDLAAARDFRTRTDRQIRGPERAALASSGAGGNKPRRKRADRRAAARAQRAPGAAAPSRFVLAPVPGAGSFACRALEGSARAKCAQRLPHSSVRTLHFRLGKGRRLRGGSSRQRGFCVRAGTPRVGLRRCGF